MNKFKTLLAEIAIFMCTLGFALVAAYFKNH